MSEETDREAKERFSPVQVARIAIAGALIVIILIIVASVVGHA